MTPWTFWIVLSAVLAVAEMMTGTFYLLILAVGALAGAGVSVLTPSTSVQVIVSAIISVIGFLVLHNFRPVQTRRKAAESPDMNIDIGSVVRVRIIEPDGTARVDYRGTSWSARVDDQGAARTDTDYRIVRIDGATLILHPA